MSGLQSKHSGARLSGTNLQRAADHNQRVTLHAIRVNGSLTRVELARITGLTSPAISNIMRRLSGEGLISKAGQLRGGRGQPPTQYVIAADACFTIGLNVDRDHVTCVILNFLGETLAQRTNNVSFALPGDVQAMYSAWIPELLQDSGIDQRRVIGVGVTTPDEFRCDVAGDPPEYCQWSTVDLKQMFSTSLGLPVFVENDVVAAAMAEMQLGLGQRLSSFFYVHISCALGGGQILENNYFRGAQGRSGQLGLLVAAEPGGEQQEIRNVVSLSGLKSHLASRGVGLETILANGRISGRAEQAMREWLERATYFLVDALVAVDCLINPEAILIGGRLPAHYVDQLAGKLDQAIRARSKGPSSAPVRRAMLSEDAAAVGGAVLPLSYFLLPKNTTLWKTSEPASRVLRGSSNNAS